MVLGALLFSLPAVAEMKNHQDSSRYPCIGVDLVLSHAMKPNCSGMSVRGGQSALATYNSVGLRDRDFSPRPAKGSSRILFMGPSNLVGPALPQNQTPPKALETLFGKGRKGARRFEVINGGVEGYFSVRLGILGKKLVREYSPNYVLLTAAGGDSLFQTLIELEYSKPDANGEPASVFHPRYPIGFPSWLVKGLGTNYKLAQLMNGLTQSIAVAKLGWRLRWLGEEGRKRYFVGETIRQLQLLRRFTEATGAKFLLTWSPTVATVAYSPHPDTTAWPINLAEKIFVPQFTIEPAEYQRALDEAGLPYVKVEIPARPEYFLPGDWHFTVAGSEAYAGAVYAKIREALPELAKDLKR